VSKPSIGSDDSKERVDEIERLRNRVDRLENILEQLLQYGYGGDQLDKNLEYLAATTTLVDRDDVDELQDDVNDLKSLVEGLRDIGQKKSSKEQKIAAIVTFADNRRKPDQRAVSLLPKDIIGAAGVKQRYAYQLADGDDGLPSEYDWVLTGKQARQQQYGNLQIDEDRQRKRLVIDFDRLQRDRESLNKFNNENGGDGESA